MVVFTASASLMIVEIVAGRIMAPYLGVSLYTWTGVIGTVVLAIGVGAALGGAMADREPTRDRLGLLCLISAGLVLFMNMLPRLVNGMMIVPGIAVALRVMAFSLTEFFPATCALEMLPP